MNINIPNRSKRGLPQNAMYVPNSPPNDGALSFRSNFSGPFDAAMMADSDDGLQYLGQAPAFEKRRRISNQSDLPRKPQMLHPHQLQMQLQQQQQKQQQHDLQIKVQAHLQAAQPQAQLQALQQLPPSPPLGKPTEIQLRQIADCEPPAFCDEQNSGHYDVKVGNMFTERYVIVSLLGQGTFGKVVECYDKVTQRHVAIKIIRAIPKYREASKIELRVLSMIAQCDPSQRYRCVQLNDCFDYRNHVCLVMDLLDISVYDFLKANSYAPFPGNHIQDFGRQILTSVRFIHSLGLVHTDLKPENILLHNQSFSMDKYRRTARGSRRSRRVLQDTSITLIDFGSAIFNDEYHPTVVSTRHYRAPEIILNTGWSHSCDIWSIGCVLVEFLTGQVLFQTRGNLEHLHLIQKVTGSPIPFKMCQAAIGAQLGEDLVRAGELVPLMEKKSELAVHSQPTLQQLVERNVPYAQNREFWDLFLDLISQMLVAEPDHRITAADALRHPWFSLAFQ